MKELKEEIAYNLAYIVYVKSFENLIEDCFKEEEQESEKLRILNNLYERAKKHYQGERV